MQVTEFNLTVMIIFLVKVYGRAGLARTTCALLVRESISLGSYHFLQSSAILDLL